MPTLSSRNFFLRVRCSSFLMCFLLISTSLSGCLNQDEISLPPAEDPKSPTTFVTGADGLPVDEELIPMSFTFSDVGETGKEPSIGITSSGCMFFIAMEKPMRSCDYGESWENTADITQAPFTSDPYGWVDPVTDRVFNIHMMGLATTWIGWSDDEGETWLGNPYDSGPIPLNDHIKLGSGPWTDSVYGGLGQLSPLYSEAVYFCYNKLLGIFCYTSYDGGATFPTGGQIYGLATDNGGLHGAITTAPDGTVYVTPRVETPTIIFSKDNGLTWDTRTMGFDALTPYPRKNSEVATDSESNAYHVWTGSDQGIYMARSTDSGDTWDTTWGSDSESIRISPAGVISTTFPQTDAGDPGRIAITYLGSENSEMLNQSDIDGNAWDGNAHYAPNNVTYHLYITFSINALDENPIFHTYRVTEDPVQVGSICLNSGDCRDIGGSNRNLLDFNDLHIDREGRVYVAFADGCTGQCATNENSSAEDSRDGRGSVYYLSSGPSLFESFGDLEPLLIPVENNDEEMNSPKQAITRDENSELVND